MRLDWRRGSVYAAIMAMEECALYALLVLLNGTAAGGRLLIYQFLFLLPLVFVFNKLLQRVRWYRITGYPINILAWAIVMLLMVKSQLYGDLAFADPSWLLAIPRALTNLLYAFEPPLLVLVLSAVTWGLGWHLARTRIGFPAALSVFQFGLAIMLIVFFVASQLNIQVDNAIPVTLAFFASALLGISIAHAQEEKGWLSALKQGHWPGLLLVSIGLVLVLGLAVSAIVTPDLLQLMLYAANWVLDQIMRLVGFLLSLLPEPGPVEPIPGINMTEPKPDEGGIPFRIPEPILAGLRLGWTILVGGFALIALWRISSDIFGWLRRRLAGTSGAEVEPIRGAFMADFIGSFKRILAKLLGFRLTIRQKQAEPPELAPVRQLYRQLLRWAAVSGWRRSAFQTPNEYLQTLEKLLPACTNDFRLITRHYVSVRYGHSPPSPEELLKLKQSWHQISQYQLTKPEKERERSVTYPPCPLPIGKGALSKGDEVS